MWRSLLLSHSLYWHFIWHPLFNAVGVPLPAHLTESWWHSKASGQKTSGELWQQSSWPHWFLCSLVSARPSTGPRGRRIHLRPTWCWYRSALASALPPWYSASATSAGDTSTRLSQQPWWSPESWAWPRLCSMWWHSVWEPQPGLGYSTWSPPAM